MYNFPYAVGADLCVRPDAHGLITFVSDCHNRLSFLVLVLINTCFCSHCALGPLHDAKIPPSAPFRQEGFASATDTLTLFANKPLFCCLFCVWRFGERRRRRLRSQRRAEEIINYLRSNSNRSQKLYLRSSAPSASSAFSPAKHTQLTCVVYVQISSNHRFECSQQTFTLPAALRHPLVRGLSATLRRNIFFPREGDLSQLSQITVLFWPHTPPCLEICLYIIYNIYIILYIYYILYINIFQGMAAYVAKIKL